MTLEEASTLVTQHRSFFDRRRFQFLDRFVLESTLKRALLILKGYSIFWASDAQKCLTSVPFNGAVASRFLKYWNETIQFQSTLAYLKNPPEGYQQPAVDVQAELARIQQNINEGSYANQYEFEADFELLTYALHDGHVTLTAGALSAFSFASPFEIASVSIDGKQPPRVYITGSYFNVANDLASSKEPA